jgi:large subunit ribosomal protein L10
MPKEEKKLMVKEIVSRLKKSQNVFVATFTGLKATDVDILRAKLEESQGDYLVVKNTLAKYALKDAKLSELSDLINGLSSFALTEDDPIKPAKVLVSFAKGHEGFKVRGGYIAGQLLLEEEIKKLASLPSREVLLGQVMGGMCSPIYGFAFSLAGLLRGLGCVLNQIKKKIASEGEGETSEETQEQSQAEANRQVDQSEGGQSEEKIEASQEEIKDSKKEGQ